MDTISTPLTCANQVSNYSLIVLAFNSLKLLFQGKESSTNIYIYIYILVRILRTIFANFPPSHSSIPSLLYYRYFKFQLIVNPSRVMILLMLPFHCTLLEKRTRRRLNKDVEWVWYLISIKVYWQHIKYSNSFNFCPLYITLLSSVMSSFWMVTLALSSWDKSIFVLPSQAIMNGSSRGNN